MIVDLDMYIIKSDGVEPLKFTNLPMERVKDAIDLLNDDHVELIPKPRTEDFTHDELFGKGRGAHKNNYSYVCVECGALVGATDIHIDWHNKLLP